MYLIDTDVISESRKGGSANDGVQNFFRQVVRDDIAIYMSVVTIGELRRGIEAIRHRGDQIQAQRLERWLARLTTDYAEAILPFDQDAAQVWGRLRVPNPENPLDKQIAATALMNNLTVVTRNRAHFEATGVRVLNPFV